MKKYKRKGNPRAILHGAACSRKKTSVREEAQAAFSSRTLGVWFFYSIGSSSFRPSPAFLSSVWTEKYSVFWRPIESTAVR